MRSAGSGLGAWLVQRVTAVYMLFFIVFVLIHFIADPPHSYSAWHGWIRSSGVSIGTAVFFGTLLAHAWVGLRDVLMDYAHPSALRIALLGLTFGLIAIGAWVVRILWV